jgi:hypothetical protein
MDQILSSLQQQLTPQTIQQMSQALGSSPTDTQKAISLALPALLGGLSGNAANPQGASSLDRALDDHDGGILDNLGGLLSGGAGGGIGGAILGHILGKKRAPVEQQVSNASGLNAQQVGQLLVMLAPIVMGVLGRMKKQGAPVTSELQKQVPGGGAGDLASILGGFFGNTR